MHFIHEIAFENVIWKMADILSRPQCVKFAIMDQFGIVTPHASQSLIIIGSGNGLAHILHQAIITWANTDLLP